MTEIIPTRHSIADSLRSRCYMHIVYAGALYHTTPCGVYIPCGMRKIQTMKNLQHLELHPWTVP